MRGKKKKNKKTHKHNSTKEINIEHVHPVLLQVAVLDSFQRGKHSVVDNHGVDLVPPLDGSVYDGLGGAGKSEIDADKVDLPRVCFPEGLHGVEVPGDDHDVGA